MLPWVLGLASEPLLPMRWVGVTEAFTLRHDEAVIQKAHDLVGRLAGPVEPLPPDNSLVAQRGELGGLGDLRAVVAGDILATLVELDKPPSDAARRNLVQIPRPIGSGCPERPRRPTPLASRQLAAAAADACRAFGGNEFTGGGLTGVGVCWSCCLFLYVM